MTDSYLFTSESVSEGHPDKVCDQISDAVLDAIIGQDRMARVACETLVKNGLVVLAGEITTNAMIDMEAVARETIRHIGYHAEMGFDGDSCGVVTAIGRQSPDIARGVDEGKGLDLEQGAGDQGLMFGYATNETDVLMPMPITLAHRLMKRQAEVRKNGKLKWLRPDAKSQVTVKYVDGKPTGIDAVVLSTQHNPEIKYAQLKEAVIEEIVKPVLPSEWLGKDTKYFINPTGSFIIGGPVGTAASPAARSSSIPTAAWRATVAAHSPAKTRPRSTARRPMPGVMSPKTSLPRVWPGAARSRWPTPSALPSRYLSM